MDPDIYGPSGNQPSEVNQIKDSSGYNIVISDIISEFFPECNIENSVEQNFTAKFDSNEYVNNLAEKKQGIKNQMMKNSSDHNGLNGHNDLNGHNEVNGHNGINGHNGLNGQPTTDSVVPSIEELQIRNESITQTNSKLEEDLTRSQQNLSEVLKELLAAKQELFPLQEKYEVTAKENTELRDQVNYFKAQVYQLTELANVKVKQDTELSELRKEIQSKEKVIKKLKNKNEAEQHSAKRSEIRKVKAMNKRLWNLVVDYGNSLSKARIMTEKQKKWAVRELAEFETLSDVYCEEEFTNNLQTTLNGFNCSIEDSSIPNISAEPTQPSTSHAFVNPNTKVPVASIPKNSALPWKITEEIIEPNSSKISNADTSETTMAEKCATFVNKPIPFNSSSKSQEVQRDLIFSDSVDEILSELGTVRQQLSFGRCVFKPVSPIPPTPPPNKTKTLANSKLAQSSDSSSCFRKRLNFCHQQSEGFDVQGSQITEQPAETVNESHLSNASPLNNTKYEIVATHNVDGSLKCDFNFFHNITKLSVDLSNYSASCTILPLNDPEMTANVDVAENASEPTDVVHSPFTNASSINNVLNWHAIHNRGRPSVSSAANASEQRKSKQASGDTSQTSKRIKMDKSNCPFKRQSVSGKLDKQAEAQSDATSDIEYEQDENNITSFSDSFMEDKSSEKMSVSAMQIQQDLGPDLDVSDIQANKKMKPKRGNTKKSNLKSELSKANKSNIQNVEVEKDSDFKYPIEGMSSNRSLSISPSILECNEGGPLTSLYSDNDRKLMSLGTPVADKNVSLRSSESISSSNTCNLNTLSTFKIDEFEMENGEVTMEKETISAFKSPTKTKSGKSSFILPGDTEESSDKFMHNTMKGKVKKKKATLRRNTFSPKKGKLLKQSQLISPSKADEADIKPGFDTQILELEKTAVIVKKENISVSRQSKHKKKAHDNNASKSLKECKFGVAVEEKQSDDSFDIKNINTLSESAFNETVKGCAKENIGFANQSVAKFKGVSPKQIDNKVTSFIPPADGMYLRKRSCSKPDANKANTSLSSVQKCNLKNMEVLVKDEEASQPLNSPGVQAQTESGSDMLTTATAEDSKANARCKTKKCKIEKIDVAPEIETIEVSDIKSLMKRQSISPDIPERSTTKSGLLSNKAMKVEDTAWREVKVSASNSHMNIKSMKRSQSISPEMIEKSNIKPACQMSLRKRSRSVISPNFKTEQSSNNELETKGVEDENIEQSKCKLPGHKIEEIEAREPSISQLPFSSVTTNNEVSIVPIKQTESPKKNDKPPDKISITSVSCKSKLSKTNKVERNKPVKMVRPVKNNPKTSTNYPFISFVQSESQIVADGMKCEENISSPKKQFIKETIESPNKMQVEQQATECIETQIREPITESEANQGIIKVKEFCKSSEKIVVPKIDSTTIYDKGCEDILSPQSPVSEGSSRNEFLSPVICTEDGLQPVLAPMETEETASGENPMTKFIEQVTPGKGDFNKIDYCSEQENTFVTPVISQVVASEKEDSFSKIHLNPFKSDTFTPSGLFKPLNIVNSAKSPDKYGLKSPDKYGLKSPLKKTFNESSSTSNSVLQSGATSPSASIENETTPVEKPQKSPSKSGNKTIFSDQSAPPELINAENMDSIMSCIKEVGNEIEVPMEINSFISNESDFYTDGELVIAESEDNETDRLTENERVGSRQFQKSAKKKSKGKKAVNKSSKKARKASTPTKDNETKIFSTEISIPDAFKALNIMKFTDSHFNQNKHTLVNALINPKNAPSMQSVVCQIIQYLSTSKANPLLNYTLKQDESDFLPVAEKCIASAIVFIHQKKGHRLPGILYSMIQTCFNFIIEKENFSLIGVSSLCRIMTEICRCVSDKTTPLKLCSEMIKIQHKFLPYVVASMACVWKELFQEENMTKEEIYFKSSVLQAVKKKPKTLTDAQWRRCNTVIKSHLQAPSWDSIEQIHEIVEFVLASVEEKSCNGTYDNEIILSTILVVITISQDWNWVKDNIVNSIQSKMDKFSTSEENEKAFDAFCELYADVAYFCPTDEVDEYFQNYFLKHYDAESSDYSFVIDSVVRSHLKYILKKRQVILPYLYQWVQNNQDNPDKVAAIKPLFERRLANESVEITEAEIPAI